MVGTTSILRPKGLDLSFDVDSVTADTSSSILRIINASRGTSYTMENIDSWNWFADTSKDHSLKFSSVYIAAWEDYKSMKPLVSQGELQELSLAYNFHFVTEMLPGARRYLKEFLGMNFPDLHAELIFRESGSGKLNLQFGLYVDDNPSLAEQIEKDGGKTLFLVRGSSPETKYKYNEHIRESERVIHVADTHAAVQRLMALARTSEENAQTKTRNAK